LDRTNWRTNLLTALLVPYVALNLPEFLFNVLRSDIGRWIAFLAVVIRLFFAPVFPNIIHGTCKQTLLVEDLERRRNE
jgi:hypothetical protein